MIDWQWRGLEQLSVTQWYALFAARQAVFVVEQNCPYQDMDGKDLGAQHLIGWDGTTVAASARVLAPGVSYAEPSIGRVITTKSHRGTGIGRELIARCVAFTDSAYPGLPVRIGAQAHLEKFYGSFGFVKASDEYLEDGIPHIEMVRSAR